MPDRPPPRDYPTLWMLGLLPCSERDEQKRLAEIVTRGGRQITSFEKFSYELISISRDVRWELDVTARNAGPYTAAVLDDLVKMMADARAALENIDDEALSALHRAADDWEYLAPPAGLSLAEFCAVPARTSGKLTRVKLALAEGEDWARAAREKTELPGRGRPLEYAGRYAVRALAELWEQQTGERPTLTTDRMTQEKGGDFLEFCGAVMRPVWDAAGQPLPSVPDLVKRHLYGQGQKGDE